MPITARYIAAQHIARRAGQLAHELFVNRSLMAAHDQPSEDRAAHGTLAISTLIVSRLTAAFPADVFSDGQRASVTDADRLWTIDAVAGERNFLRGIEFYAIAIAYAERGCCEVAVVYDPEHDEMFHALRGQGAWCERGGHECRLEVARCASLERALISIALDERERDPEALPRRRELIDAGAAARVLGAPALELAHVAAGRLDGFVGLGLAPLRLMGALLLVEEAGGYVSHRPAAGGIRNDLPIVGCATTIARQIEAVNGAWDAEVAVDLGIANSASGRLRRHGARPRWPFS